MLHDFLYAYGANPHITVDLTLDFIFILASPMSQTEVDTEARYQTLRQELQSLAAKYNELEIDADEHRIVIAAITPLPPTRKCWRRVGGVLLETNVGDSLPTLDANLKGVSLNMSLSVSNFSD